MRERPSQSPQHSTRFTHLVTGGCLSHPLTSQLQISVHSVPSAWSVFSCPPRHTQIPPSPLGSGTESALRKSKALPATPDLGDSPQQDVSTFSVPHPPSLRAPKGGDTPGHPPQAPRRPPPDYQAASVLERPREVQCPGTSEGALDLDTHPQPQPEKGVQRGGVTHGQGWHKQDEEVQGHGHGYSRQQPGV